MNYQLKAKMDDGRWLTAWKDYGKPWSFKTLEAAERIKRELLHDYKDVRIVGK